MPPLQKSFTLTSVTGPTDISEPINFNAGSVQVDNWTNQIVYLPEIDRYIDPYTTGAIYLYTSHILRVKFSAPGTFPQASAKSGEICKVTVYANTVPFALANVQKQVLNLSTWVEHFEDNIDAGHPYSANFYIPTQTLTVSQLLLSWKNLSYRYYVSAAASSSATQAGPHAHPISQFTNVNTGSAGSLSSPTSTDTPTSGNQLTLHTHVTSGVTSGTESTNHAHQVSHGHTINNVHFHSQTQPTATDNDNPAHTHQISTNVTLTPGIVETTSAGTLQLKVDGNVASTALNATDFDITSYLTKDANGLPTTGWHTLVFTPNQNARIQADLVSQVYTQR